jgi:hypothetical protein
MKKHLQVWLNFLDSYNGVSVMLDHFLDFKWSFRILLGQCWRNSVPEGFRYLFSRQMGPGFLAFRLGKKLYSSGYYVFRTPPSWKIKRCCFISTISLLLPFQTKNRQNHGGSWVW